MARSGCGRGESSTPSTSGGPGMGTPEGNEDVSPGLRPREGLGWMEQPDLGYGAALPRAGRGSGEFSTCPREWEKSVPRTKRSFFLLAPPMSSC